MACNFKPKGGPPEAYVGTLTRVGLDIGVTGGGAIIWGVFTSTNLYAGMLTGTYVGASAEASIAAGLGANVLVGGSNRAVALQPLSVQGQTGLNIAAGVEPAGAASRPINCRAARRDPARNVAPLDQPRRRLKRWVSGGRAGTSGSRGR